MIVREALLSIINYPVPESAIENIVDSRTLGLNDEATPELRSRNNYRLAEADVFMWVSFAPNIQEGGVNINLLFSDRKELREKANQIYRELNDPKQEPLIRQEFTYQGEEV